MSNSWTPKSTRFRANANLTHTITFTTTNPLGGASRSLFIDSVYVIEIPVPQVVYDDFYDYYNELVNSGLSSIKPASQTPWIYTGEFQIALSGNAALGNVSCADRTVIMDEDWILPLRYAVLKKQSSMKQSVSFEIGFIYKVSWNQIARPTKAGNNLSEFHHVLFC